MSSHKNKDASGHKHCKGEQAVCECAQKKLKQADGKEECCSGGAQAIRPKGDSPSGLCASATTGRPAVPAPLNALLTMHLEKVAETLESKGFTVSLAGSVQDALDIVQNQILPARKGNFISFGGSTSVVASGLFDALKNNPELDVLDTYDMSVGQEVLVERRRQALLSDLYFTSVNAITKDGKLLWLDGIGNRTAAVQFGPRQVVILAGRNKICENVDAGIKRIKNIAAPANVLRLKRNTPCAKTGHCMDCKSPESVCSMWTVMRRCNPVGRIHIVLVNEDLGF